MNISLKRAFAAVTMTLAGTTATIALADEAPSPETESLTLSAQNQQNQPNQNEETVTLDSLLAGASDATPEDVRYNQWFIDRMLEGISQIYVEDVTIEELEQLALEGAEKLARDNSSYTMDQYVEAALDGVLNTLDPHSDYINAEELEEMKERTRGGFVGIGVRIEMDQEKGLLKVVKPIEGSPAEAAGIEEGDIITHIGGQSMQGKTLEENIELMRGQIGTDVDVTVQRPGAPDPITVTITRAMIESSPVSHEVIGDIAYIRITQFNDITTAKLEEAVQELQDEMGEENIKGYVLDLRFNPGGLLNEAISVVDSFIDEGGIVATGDTSGENLRFVQARTGDITNGAPVAVLVNGASASASEIVAGALQDHGRATVVGTQTFGKGSVQRVMPLGAYFRGREDAMKITTQLYYTPSGDTIQNRGVTPDIRTEFQDTASDGRINISEAELSGVIDNPELVGDTAQTASSCDVSDVVPDLGTLDDSLVLELRDGTSEPDYQLLCAIEHLENNQHYTVIEPVDVTPAERAAPAP